MVLRRKEHNTLHWGLNQVCTPAKRGFTYGGIFKCSSYFHSPQRTLIQQKEHNSQRERKHNLPILLAQKVIVSSSHSSVDNQKLKPPVIRNESPVARTRHHIIEILRKDNVGRPRASQELENQLYSRPRTFCLAKMIKLRQKLFRERNTRMIF